MDGRLLGHAADHRAGVLAVGPPPHRRGGIDGGQSGLELCGFREGDVLAVQCGEVLVDLHRSILPNPVATIGRP
jgi:hypothetical protein